MFRFRSLPASSRISSRPSASSITARSLPLLRARHSATTPWCSTSARMPGNSPSSSRASRREGFVFAFEPGSYARTILRIALAPQPAAQCRDPAAARSASASGIAVLTRAGEALRQLRLRPRASRSGRRADGAKSRRSPVATLDDAAAALGARRGSISSRRISRASSCASSRGARDDARALQAGAPARARRARIWCAPATRSPMPGRCSPRWAIVPTKRR